MITDTNETDPGALPLSHRLIAFRIIQLHYLMRSATAPTYRDALQLTAGEVAVLMSIGFRKALTASELLRVVGQSKSQVSRTIAPMLAKGHIGRASLRAPLTLTAEGEALFARILAQATDNANRLLADLGENQLRILVRAMGPMSHAAEQLLEEAQEAVGAPDRISAYTPASQQLFSDVTDISPSSVTARLSALASVLSRSAALVFRESTSLSGFKWVALARIAEFDPLRLSELIRITGRDKGQIGRVVDELEAEGLVLRHPYETRGKLTLGVTDKGRHAFSIVAEESLRREAIMLRKVRKSDRKAVFNTIDVIGRNARAWIAENRGQTADG